MSVASRKHICLSFLFAGLGTLAMIIQAGCGSASTKSAQAGAGPQAIPVAVQAVEQRDMTRSSCSSVGFACAAATAAITHTIANTPIKDTKRRIDPPQDFEFYNTDVTGDLFYFRAAK